MMGFITVTDTPMVATDTTRFPLVDLRPVSNSAHQWVALSARMTAAGGADGSEDMHADEGAPASPWHAVFDTPDLLTAIAPLDCIVHLPGPAVLDQPLLAKLQSSRVLFAVDAAALQQDGVIAQLSRLQESGYRVLLDGAGRPGTSAPATLRAVAHDCAHALKAGPPLATLFGPHLAHGVDTPELFSACGAAGFAWFSGAHAENGARAGGAADDPDDGITARRLLKLLGLLLADAETREIETQLKQDPALSYHLLRLVNSAAFAPATPIHNFAQAIDRLGRRQLLRWLQLLLYARPRADGLANPLLPIAAMRAARIESLCKQHGCDRDAQDLSFQVGVFSLLDVLLGMPMAEIVAALFLPPDAAGALLHRSGVTGGLLALVEAPAPTADALLRAGVTHQQWWISQLHGFHWAIQVSRNL
jgi:EAL and modified HD-GYP domain-containing signal transduction protein